MTLYGIDVSNHQGNFDFGAAKREGFSFATHKVTEGDGYRDPYWPRAREEMLQRFTGLFAGYHFARNNVDVNRQADALLAHLGDTSIPIQLDYEDTSTRGSIENMRALIAAIEARGMRVFANYLPRWYWTGHMGAPRLDGTPVLWNSHYVNGTGYASALYPGDGHAGWESFHAGAPEVKILQFSERGLVAGQSIDVNAFRGSEDELRALFGGAPIGGGVVADVPTLIQDQLAGPGGQGWELLGRSKVDPARFNTLVEAVAEVRSALVEPRPSFVDGSTVKLDVPTFVQCTDAATFRAEREVVALRAEVKALTDVVKTLVEKVGK
ncbi:glycoside hydrolase family 25 protein [Rhodococcus ruber]|uniref:glycoside hydrolase family 25 protein n=1 Tax=Rhodococcus ruber TaxID=1830 RepID=UPI0022B46D63|nr:glycoside hydrolase family 25 protein [Rhodococcus ruber]MCZ4505943.1 glycoside hydrolase family 25 protein [Rhodococcus ruber]